MPHELDCIVTIEWYVQKLKEAQEEVTSTLTEKEEAIEEKSTYAKPKEIKQTKESEPIEFFTQDQIDLIAIAPRAASPEAQAAINLSNEIAQTGADENQGNLGGPQR